MNDHGLSRMNNLDGLMKGCCCVANQGLFVNFENWLEGKAGGCGVENSIKSILNAYKFSLLLIRAFKTKKIKELGTF